jgi:hypothetical protein
LPQTRTLYKDEMIDRNRNRPLTNSLNRRKLTKP